MKRFISISLAPNLTGMDIFISCKQLLSPYHWFFWKRGKWEAMAEAKLNARLGVSRKVYFFDKARSGLYLLLKALDVREGDEVIIQPYTCIVLPNAIIACGAKPVYVDIERTTFNIDPEKIESKITARTRGIVIQHTFGLPSDYQAIKKIADKHGLWILEDCAHSLGAKYQGQKVGTLGVASFFSFGRDKIISCTDGGAVVCHEAKLEYQFNKLYRFLKYPSAWWSFQRLAHGVIFAIGVPLYLKLGIGRFLIWLSRKLAIIPAVYTDKEKKGGAQPLPPRRLPNCLLNILCHQLDRLEEFNEHRWQTAALYQQGLNNLFGVLLPKLCSDSQCAWLRYPILIARPEILEKEAKERGILLGDWYRSVIVPLPPDLGKVFYNKGECPVAEEVSKLSLNLPTHHRIREKDIVVIVKMIREFQYRRMPKK
ncbi:MAG: aminotransferase class I/II-fold pyridoxal phosphate-dependent enzyme [Parcubacteria group bacterium]|nr:aminotransferase class I/II-fold pyridoxal phosphate-dependent enzyme [Parcubacteria group bacterium]